MTHELLTFNEEVADAIHAKQPIVVLEAANTPYRKPNPDHASITHLIEQIVRDNGAIPATVSIYKGKIHIGTDASIIDELAEEQELMKASIRDLAYILSRKISASTSVAATMFCAHLAQLPLLVTGGIGGVHHQMHENYAISADLIELFSTPVTVVCSGAKSILDLPKTIEMLESHGVAVVGYGTDEFPAFYSQSSGISLLHRLDNAKEIADLMHYQQVLGLKQGIVIANPIPKSAEIPDHEMRPIVDQAQREAQQVNIKTITPFLLQRIAELTAGQSLHASIELLKNNALLGAAIAIAHSERQKSIKH